MSTNQVTISTPRVHTLQVTVRALRIGTKQVTQSVFRQLPQRHIWDPMTGALHGQPWGMVNYFWGDCSAGNHLHVVWQQGERLFRSCVYHPARLEPEGVSRLKARIKDHEEVLAQGALFVAALALYLKGWTLEPLLPPKVFRIVWPSGLNTTVDAPTGHTYGQSDLSLALSRVFQLRSDHAVESRPNYYETSNTLARPSGEGWTEHLPHQNYTPQFHWARYRPERQEEYMARRQQELTTAYDALYALLCAEAKTEWDLEPLPTEVNDAKEAIDSIAEHWRLDSAELPRLQQHFLSVYEQLTELEQLFIAV